MKNIFKTLKLNEIILLVISFGLIFFGVWLDLEMPIYLGNMTNYITGAIPDGTVSDILHQGGLMLLFTISSVLVSVIVSLIGSIISSRIAQRLRKDIYGRVGEFSQTEIKKFSIASLITRSTNDITQIRMFTAMFIQMAIRVPILAVWALIKINYTSYELTLVTFGALAAIIVIPMILIGIVIPQFRKVQKLTDDITGVARESLTGVRVVRAFNADDYQNDKFEKINEPLFIRSRFVNRIMAIAFPFIGLILNVVVVLIYLVGSYLINYGNVSPIFIGDMMVFNHYSMQILFAFLMLIMIIVQLPRTVVSMKRVNETLNTRSSIINKITNTVLPDGDIEFKDVTFQYPDGEEEVLTNVSLKIKKGTTAAFIGVTGGGKSTLVNLLARVFDPTEGEILIGETNIKDISLETLYNNVGYIPQKATIFKGTIKENIGFGEVNGLPIGEEQINNAINIAQASDFINALDNGFDSEVNQDGTNFSGGQKQRIAIARVLARNPKILIFDDTYSALDYKTDFKLRTEIKSKFKNTTTLIVAQRIGTIKNADCIFVLDNGQIHAAGTHDELYKKSDLYRNICLSQLDEKELVL